MSHLVSIPFDMDELDRFAHRLGLKSEYLDGDHYDVCRSKRREAIEFGATPVSTRELVSLRRRARQRSEEIEQL